MGPPNICLGCEGSTCHGCVPGLAPLLVWSSCRKPYWDMFTFLLGRGSRASARGQLRCPACPVCSRTWVALEGSWRGKSMQSDDSIWLHFSGAGREAATCVRGPVTAWPSGSARRGLHMLGVEVDGHGLLNTVCQGVHQPCVGFGYELRQRTPATVSTRRRTWGRPLVGLLCGVMLPQTWSISRTKTPGCLSPNGHAETWSARPGERGGCPPVTCGQV